MGPRGEHHLPTEALRERPSTHEDFLRVRRVLGYAVAAWASNLGLDLVTALVLGQGRLSVLLGIRAVTTLAFIAILLRLHVEPRPSAGRFRALAVLVMLCAGGALALLAVEQGTAATAYAHAVSVTLVAYGLAFQEPWRRGALLASAPVLAFIVTLLGGALFAPKLSTDLARRDSLGTLFENLFLVGITWGLVVTGGHIVHAMRREALSHRGLGRYELRERIARGGMGEIWRAHHVALDREVAVKIVRPDRASLPKADVRFSREVRALAELQHPNTVRILDHGVTSDGVRYFAMELLEGEPLESRLERDEKIEPAKAVAIASDVARALAEAHARGIIHRDVTPKNLFLAKLVTGEEIVKILDFGIAKENRDDDGDTTTLTAHGKVVGTPAYMAPEQARGVEVDARTDVYALGAVLYRMVCGRPPFERPSHAETIQAHVWDAPPKPSWLADVGPELEAVLLRCLRKVPGERFESASALADALDAVARAGTAAPQRNEAPRSADPAFETVDAPLSRE